MYHCKTLHPHQSNNITPMVSGGFQSPFIAGGNQVAYYLGIQGNSGSTPPDRSQYSTYEKIIKESQTK